MLNRTAKRSDVSTTASPLTMSRVSADVLLLTVHLYVPWSSSVRLEINRDRFDGVVCETSELYLL